MVDLGPASEAIPLRRLTADRLATALIAATRDGSCRRRAQELSRTVATEDGAGAVAAALPSLVQHPDGRT